MAKKKEKKDDSKYETRLPNLRDLLRGTFGRSIAAKVKINSHKETCYERTICT